METENEKNLSKNNIEKKKNKINHLNWNKSSCNSVSIFLFTLPGTEGFLRIRFHHQCEPAHTCTYTPLLEL